MDQSPTMDRAPWHLWVVGILLLLWHAMGAFDYIATLLRYEPYLSKFPEDALAYYFAAPKWMYAMWGISAFGGLIGGILVLMRNQLVVPLFAVALACSVVAVSYTHLNPPPGGGHTVFSLIVIGAAALVLFYLYMMKKSGALR